MTYDFFKTSDDNEAILDVSSLSQVQLRNYNVQALVTKWDEICSAYTDPTSRHYIGMSLQNAIRKIGSIEKSEALKYLLQVFDPGDIIWVEAM